VDPPPTGASSNASNAQPLRSTIAGHLLGSSSTEVEDKFRPSRPNYLYLLAEEARDGDYRNHERFLNTLGHEATGDTLLNLEERLRITFNPQGSNTREWWLEPSGEAAYWLKKRIADEPRPDNFVELDPRLIDRKQKNLDRRKFLEPELREFMMRETLYAILPQRQAEIAWLYVQFHDEDRPRETTKAIAEFLQISPATVRWHKAEALKSPQFKKMLGLS
jgi:hypothetical protein